MEEKVKMKRKFADGNLYWIRKMKTCEISDDRSFGFYACSPEDSSFKTVFTQMNIMECMWKEHK